jgi:tetratricopeptide (TPR) repeat protein
MPHPVHELLRDRWNDVDRLFGEALALAEGERHPFLERACGGDTLLLDTVSRLLASSDRAARELDGPGTGLLRAAFGTPTASEDSLSPGTPIDRYRLLREIGRGGMATVYEAERADGTFDGRVALKILRGIDSDDLSGRLVAERQILSSLAHPHIARLLDGGTSADGRPFLVMELVAGSRIITFASERHLDVRGRIELFLQVVDAVQYAHQHLVVHRDIKPSNVLVDERGTVRLLDFGIAKLLDADPADGALTRPATRWMTPQYASPEQILGRPVTTATDVHGLGALLYELLCGQRPFGDDGRSGFELERAICEDVPELPSAVARKTAPEKLARTLSGDLDAIVARCLRKVPRDRYGSAQELHDDLRRYLTGFPVRAREGHGSYRVRKFLTRHRGAVTAAALVAMVLVGSGAVLVRLQAETAAQRDLATAAAGRARTEAENAQLVIDFLADVFRGRDPSQAPGDTITARELLSWGVERVGTEFADRPAVQGELLMVLGEASVNLGLIDDGVELGERSVELARRTFGDRGLETAEALSRLGTIRRTEGNMVAAASLYSEAVSIRTDLDPLDPDLSGPLTGLGLALTRLRQRDSAVVLLRRAVALEAGRHGGVPSPEPMLHLALTLRNAGQLDEARRLYEEAIPAYRAQPDHDAGDLAAFLNNLGYLRRVDGDFAGAIDAYEEALGILVGLFGRGHPSTVTVADNLASVLNTEGRDGEALSVLRETLEASEAAYPDGHWRLAAARGNVGDALLRQGRIDEAIPFLEDRATYYEREFGPSHDWTSFAYARIAVVRLLRGDTARGRAFLDRLHDYLATQGLNPGVDNLLVQFVGLLADTGPAGEYERFRALHPDSAAVDAGVGR